MTDTDLLQGIRRGDSRAFERLYRSHKDAVYAFACSLSGRVDEAEDLVHEAFLGLIRHAESIDPSKSIRGYLFRSVRNRHIDRRRLHASRNRSLEAAADAEATSRGPAESTLANERCGLVRRALDALPEGQGEVVRLRLFGKLDFGTIASEVKAPLPTVRSRYRAALDRLRSSLRATLGKETE